MVSTPSPPPTYVPPAPTPPDPFATAEAQTGYNINSAKAQTLLNAVNQVTPYGQIHFKQTGGEMVGAEPALADTPATGGYWDGHQWVSTGGSKGHPATAGHFVPSYTATTTLSPAMQALVDKNTANAQATAGIQGTLLKNVENTASKPLDLSWGNIASNIYGLERNTLDPYWKQQQEVKDQQLANQGLTPGSQGWGYEQSQFGLNKANAYDKAMLDAQGQASSDIQAQYNSPVNQLNALRTGTQIAQPGVQSAAPTGTAAVNPANYQGIATSNYQTGVQAFDSAVKAQTDRYNTQAQQQGQVLGGLFGLGGDLLRGVGGLI